MGVRRLRARTRTNPSRSGISAPSSPTKPPTGTIGTDSCCGIKIFVEPILLAGVWGSGPSYPAARGVPYLRPGPRQARGARRRKRAFSRRDALGDLRAGGAAAAGRALDHVPGVVGGEQAGDGAAAVGILPPPHDT